MIAVNKLNFFDLIVVPIYPFCLIRSDQMDLLTKNIKGIFLDIKKALFSALALIVISFTSLNASAIGLPKYEECNYCSSDASFRSYATFISNNYSAGNYDVSIINKNNYEIWHVEVNVEIVIGFETPDEGDLEGGGLPVIDEIKMWEHTNFVTIYIDTDDYPNYEWFKRPFCHGDSFLCYS